MFLEFYHLREQPFGETPDPRFLYLGNSHREALASLFYGVQADCGFTALIADPGLGKTTLTVQVLESLNRFGRTIFLCQTQCNSREFLHSLLDELGVDVKGMDMVSIHKELKEIINKEIAAGRRFILAIDEAQNLDPAVLETIRLLSNVETSSTKLIQILLIGQHQLACKLASSELKQLQQRITVFAGLTPFGLEDTGRYIAHRLRVAAYNGEPLFTREALQIIQVRSQGIPRSINRLCFNALSIGCAMRRKRIDSEIMEEVVEDLNIDRLARRSAMPETTSELTIAGAMPVIRPEKRCRWLSRWRAMRAAACLVTISATMMFLHSSGHSHAMSEVAASIPSPTAPTKSSTQSAATSERTDQVGVDIVETRASQPMPSLGPNHSDGTTTVVVQSGDDLRQIAIRTIGHYQGKVIDQIRSLNPDLTDPDHIQIGQTIKLPRTSQSNSQTPAGN